MRGFTFIVLFLLAIAVQGQLPMKTEAELQFYPTYRTLTKIPIDSVYKMTLENPHEISADFDKFVHLQKLCIFGNEFDYDFYQLPAYFYTFENLTHLTIANTDLQAIGKNISKFENLQSLSVANNSLIALPVELGKIEDLRYLSIDNNIKRIPEIGSLTELVLYFETNVGDDSGSIPMGITDQRRLKTLEINSEVTLINIPEMISIIKTLPALERLTFIDPNLEEDHLRALTGIKKITELNLPAIEISPEILGGFSHLKHFSFGKYLESDPAKRKKFWETLLSFKDLEEVSTTFEFSDTAYYRQCKKLNLTLNLDGGLPEQISALKDMPSLYRLTLPRSSVVPRNLSELKTIREIDITDLYGVDGSIIFGYLMVIPSLEKIVASNDQFTKFPPETVKMVHIKAMEIINIEHSGFAPISEAEKAKARKLLPNCTFTYEEMFR